MERDGGWTKDTHPETKAKAEYSPCPGCLKCLPNGGYVLRRGKWRCTTAHEYVFQFAKSGLYFCDGEAAKEDATSTSGGACVGKSGNADAGARRMSAEENAAIRSGHRNPRTVWKISSEPSSEKHFAAYPSELVRRCLAPAIGCGKCCPDCGAMWAPVVVEMTDYSPQLGEPGIRRVDESRGDKTRKISGAEYAEQKRTRIFAHRPTCACAAEGYARPTVLDPFSGTGTTGQTALALGANYIGIELNPEYIGISERKLRQPPRWKRRNGKPRPVPTSEPLLF